MPQTELIQAMRETNFYNAHSPVQFIQTHISCLFLTEDHVYKLKKPINLGFLDFSTLEKRYFYCHEEVRLNSRLAPSVYLGVKPVSRDPKGRFFLGQDSGADIIDYVVHMRRLSEDSMFPALLRQGWVDDNLLFELSGLLADFHARARLVPGDSEMGSLHLIRGNLEENFDQTQMLREKSISTKRHKLMRRIMLSTLDRTRELFVSRHEQGKTRECHGDLRMEHICRFQGQLIAFDCIEFNERFRFIDTAADLAFLLMDMEYNGYWSQAATLLQAYVQSSGDREALAVIDLYKAYYALTRGKVLGIESTEQEFTSQERREALNMATRFLDLAWFYALKLHPPTLIILCGLMGTGKSELAGYLSRKLDAHVLRSDVLRKRLHGLDPQSRHNDAYGQGLYTREKTQATYQALVDQARPLLVQGHSVILDASFRRREYREMASDLARGLDLPCVILECVCSDQELQKRLRKRQAQGTDVSNGRLSLLAAQKADFETISDSEGCAHVAVDTQGELEQVQESALESVLQAMGRQEKE
ncbi:MAG: AAA family ATPase [Desulfovermiculus sp.]|nr:AAA family ATPase [Desulfovermiculus sp.]